MFGSKWLVSGKDAGGEEVGDFNRESGGGEESGVGGSEGFLCESKMMLLEEEVQSLSYSKVSSIANAVWQGTQNYEVTRVLISLVESNNNYHATNRERLQIPRRP